MITDGEKWRYLAIKKLPALLRGKILLRGRILLLKLF